MSQIPLITSATQVLQSIEAGARAPSPVPRNSKPFGPSFEKAQADKASGPERRESPLSDRADRTPAHTEHEDKQTGIERGDDSRHDEPDRESLEYNQDEDSHVIDVERAPRPDAKKSETNEKLQQDGEVVSSDDDQAQRATLGEEESTVDGEPRIIGIEEQSLVVGTLGGSSADMKADEQGRSPAKDGSARVSPQYAALRDSANQDSAIASKARGHESSLRGEEQTAPVEAEFLAGVVGTDDEGEADTDEQAGVRTQAERVATQPLTPGIDSQIAKPELASDRLSAASVPQAVNTTFAESRHSGEGLGDRSDAQRQEAPIRVTTNNDSGPKQTNTEALFQIDRLADAGIAKTDPTSMTKSTNETGHLARQQSSAAHGADGRLVSQSVSRGLAAAIQQNEGEVVLRLSPASLGVVRIKMSLDHGAVSVRLETTTQAAQQAMSDNLGALRNSLENRGLMVERVSVHHTPPAGGHSANGSQSGSSQQGGSNNSETGEHANKHDAGDAPSQGRRDGSSGSGMFDPEGTLDAEAHGDPATFEQQFHVRLETVA